MISPLHEIYRKEIQEFFEGKKYWDSREKGHIWVANHEGFDTLTVEPKEGGQYEIAVRVLQPDLTYSGYYAKEGFFGGVRTDGH